MFLDFTDVAKKFKKFKGHFFAGSLKHIEPYVYLQHVLGWQAKKTHRDSQTKVATTIVFFRFTNLANAIYQPKKTVKVKHTEKAVMAQKSQKWLEIKMQQGQWTDG